MIKNKMANIISGAEEIILDTFKITTIGNERINVRNYKLIEEYTDSLITLAVKNGNLRIYGKELEIKNISDSELNIEGRMDEIKFTGGGK
ncbi:MAG: sporulation protein YqfC [Clostridia bacterium]|nr:sporulation protein YqfC [Clostridia bacterium]